MSVVEIKMVVNNQGEPKNINFFTSIDVNCSIDEIVERITKKITDVIDDLPEDKCPESGYAIALWQGDELFTFSFLTTNDEKGVDVKWTNHMMDSENDPTIH